MPGIEDLATTPLAFVDKSFQHCLTNPEANWPDHVEHMFGKLDNLDQINSINETPNHMLIDGQMATFRCMIQDMFDPELFMDKYGVKDLATGQVRFETSRYKDTLHFGAKEEPVEEGVKYGERQSFYCVSIPGESPWVKDVHAKRAPLICHPSTSSSNQSNKVKRPNNILDDNDQDEQEVKKNRNVPATNNVDDQEMADLEANKDPVGASDNPMLVNDQPTRMNLEQNLNLPIAKSQGHAVIVKLYDVTEGMFKLNDMVQFTGIISLSPTLANIGSNVDKFEEEEVNAKNPPPSLIPRLHVVKHVKLSHCNTLLPHLLSCDNDWQDMRRSREDLHHLMTQMLLGDSVAADYLLCHLMSHIYHRKDGMVLGKFSLNLFNIPTAKNYAKRLATIIQLLLTQSHFVNFTTDYLNNATFVPKKNYGSNRLTSGLLQLANGTHLILDETAMQNGQLNQVGLGNLTSLGQTIKFQSVDYDFGFHKIAFETDIAFLVLSEGRSMLPSDAQVMLKPQVAIDEEKIDEVFAGIGNVLDSQLLSRLRIFITQAKFNQFELAPEAQSFVEEDFVRERQNSASILNSGDDLHSILVLARLLSLSRGEKSLNPSLWNEAKAMEIERKQRMAHLPTRPSL